MPKNWVDFKTVKEAVSLERVLERYAVNGLQAKGQTRRGRCPIHKGDGARSFHADLSKNAFHCFSCGAKGNVLDFVAAMEQASIRDAALKLQEWFLAESDTASREPVAQHQTGPEPHQVEPGAEQPESGKTEAVNAPLTFQLKVNMNHEYGQNRGLTPQTLAHFGAGFCQSRGMFAGRFVIPLHNEVGQLVGYAGRSIDGREPKYLFPSSDRGFHKKRLLFNFHRVKLNEPERHTPLVIVEGFFDCMKVSQAGLPCVAILGSSLSTEQERVLVDNFELVVLLFDGDAAGKAATEDCLKRLSRQVFVRVVAVPEGEDPGGLSPEQLRGLLG